MTTDLNSKRVLICNDDGIDAPGIGRLIAVAEKLFGEVWVIAPSAEQSAKSRAISLREKLYVDQKSERRFAVHGTPADCGMVAFGAIMKDQLPDLFLSGVNFGANLGEDVGYSGTVGCAMEAALAGIPAIALSECHPPPGESDRTWQVTDAYLEQVIAHYAAQPIPRETVLNINFPCGDPARIKGMVHAPLGRRLNSINMEPTRKEGHSLGFVYSFQRENSVRGEGTDLHKVREGYITATLLNLDNQNTDPDACLELAAL